MRLPALACVPVFHVIRLPPIVAGKTLLFLAEIQACIPAITFQALIRTSGGDLVCIFKIQFP